jgi:predicted flap endonuclease-1-like 5' DNA nuclease
MPEPEEILDAPKAPKNEESPEPPEPPEIVQPPIPPELSDHEAEARLAQAEQTIPLEPKYEPDESVPPEIVPPPEAPVLDSITPVSAPIQSGDVTATIAGSGFTASSVVVWNGIDDTSTFVDENTITTVIKTDMAGVPSTVTVAVRNDTEISNEISFEFTALEEGEEDEKTEEDESEDEIEEEDEGIPIPVTEIPGIGPATATKLAAEGITDARQIAELTSKAAEALDDRLGLSGRIETEGWIQSAKELIEA